MKIAPFSLRYAMVAVLLSTAGWFLSESATLADGHLSDENSPREVTQPALSTAPQGLIVLESPYGITETVTRLRMLLEGNGITVFAQIDHAVGALNADLLLRPTQVLIFGNPRVGTPLMQCGQSIAIDLPQKALVWQDATDQVYLGYNDPRYLADRHGLTDCEAAIARVEMALARISQAAVGTDPIPTP
ncbi:MAG: DUF302 domain-containing protein [Cyanobacteria bacterium P01_C01_bin.73]